MARVKNVSHHDISIVIEGERRGMQTTMLIKPKAVANVPLCYQLKHLVAEGCLALVDGGKIVDIPGGMRHMKAPPIPPLRSVDDPWES